MNGLFLLPSLDRPEQLCQFFKAYKETESVCKGLVLIDHGDYLSKQNEYESLEVPDGWSIVQTNGVSMGDKVREMMPKVIDLDWVGILNDDHRPRTKNWDQKLLAHMTGVNIVGCNDGATVDKPWNAPRRLAGAIVFGGILVRTLGYIFPEGLHHFFSDDVWQYLGGRSQCAQIDMNVCVEHEHAYLHPEKRDKTFERVNGANIEEELKKTGQGSGGFWPGDREAFQKWFKESAEADALKLIQIQPKMGVMIGTPFHGGYNAVDFTVGLMDTALGLASNNIHFEFARIENSSLLPHARNSIVDLFLRSRCQKLLFIDSDQGFNKDHIFHLLNSARPIVAGVTPHKRFPMNMNFEPLPEDEKYFKDSTNKSEEEFFKFVKEKADIKGEIEVNRAGTGFFMIDRSVIQLMSEREDLISKYQPFDGQTTAMHSEMFKMGIMGDRYRGEDWFFCTMAKELEIPIHINTNVLVSHVGNFKFQIDERKRIA